MVNVAATDAGTIVIEYPNDDVTVIFECAAYSDMELYEKIAVQHIYGERHYTPNNDEHPVYVNCTCTGYFHIQ